MILLNKNHWVFSENRMLYRAEKQSSAPEVKTADKEAKDKKPKIYILPKNPTSDDVLKQVKNSVAPKHHPDVFEKKLRELLKENATEKMIATAKARYESAYYRLIGQFYRRAEKRRIDMEYLKQGVQLAARKQLNALKTDVESRKKVKESVDPASKIMKPVEKDARGKSIPIIGPLLRKLDLPILSPLIDKKSYRQYREFKRESSSAYLKYIQLKNNQYLKSAQYTAKLSNNVAKRKYTRLTDKFSKGLEAYTEIQLEAIFRESKTKEQLKSRLEGLSNEINNTYSGNDKDSDGALDLKELHSLEQQTVRFVDLAKLINSNLSESELLSQLNQLNFFNKETFRNAGHVMTEQLIIDSRRDGSREGLIKAAQKLSGKKETLSPADAEDTLRSVMKNNIKLGVKEALSALKTANDAINGKRVGILKLEHVKPNSIHILVRRQRDLILERKIGPRNPDDRMVAEFMSTSQNGRIILLKDRVKRQALFQSIQNIKTHYPKTYSKEYKNGIPKKISELSTRSKHPDQPTSHDKAARLLAMQTLAMEAEWVIKNFSDSKELKKDNISKELDNTKAEKVPPLIDLNFRSVDTLYKRGYVSRAERGGFNGRDVALTALKVWAGVTLFMNFMNARKSEGGWIAGFKAVASNPYAWAGAAGIYGVNKVQQNPAYLNYLKMGSGSRETLNVQTALNSFTTKKLNGKERVGRSRLKNFINTPSEFKVIEHLMANPKEGSNTVKKLLEKSRKNAAKTNKLNEKNKTAAKQPKAVPVLSAKDMKEKIGEELYAQLPKQGNDRLRYLFYEKFLTSARNVREFKKNCQTWV